MFEITIASIAAILGAIVGAVVPRILDARKAKTHQIYKFVYVKVYHLKRKSEDTGPVYKKYISRLNRDIDIYDEFHMFKLNIFKAERKTLTVSDTSSGIVDLQILHPRQRVTFSDIGAAKKKDFINQVFKKPSAVFFTRSMYYNGCQKGNEQFAIKMEQDTDEARIIIDFTSIPDFSSIIKGNPKGCIRKGDHEESLAVGETAVPGVYEVSTRKLEQGHVLRADFNIDWNHQTLN